MFSPLSFLFTHCLIGVHPPSAFLPPCSHLMFHCGPLPAHLLTHMEEKKKKKRVVTRQLRITVQEQQYIFNFTISHSALLPLHSGRQAGNICLSPHIPKHIQALHVHPSRLCFSVFITKLCRPFKKTIQVKIHTGWEVSGLFFGKQYPGGAWRLKAGQHSEKHIMVHYCHKWCPYTPRKIPWASLKCRENLSTGQEQELGCQKSVTFNKCCVFISRKSLKSLYCRS